MSPTAKKEFLKTLAPRYQKSRRKERSRILDEFCVNFGYNRKYAIRKLLAYKLRRRPATTRKPGPGSKYAKPELLKPLQQIWLFAHLPCSKRLKAILPEWISPYQSEFGFLSPKILDLLESISPATIDRILKPFRILHTGTGRSATKPGLLLKHHIPIKTNQWDESKPGFLEADTVAHCGTSLLGTFVYTLDTTDIATGWTEQRAVWGKGEGDILKQLQDIESCLPFPILGFDCDNGSEFLNWHLVRHFQNRKRPVQFTRSRPYKKNDNAHVEQKNWTQIRQWLAYGRFENPKIVPALNDLYRNEWRLFLNFFLPSTKLVEKKRVGSKIVKRHDKPLTPYRRTLNSEFVSESNKAALRTMAKNLNPFKLKRTIDEKIARIHHLARLPSS
ncbi:MAG: integrase [Candidatus Omnitrophota bacterium]